MRIENHRVVVWEGCKIIWYAKEGLLGLAKPDGSHFRWPHGDDKVPVPAGAVQTEEDLRAFIARVILAPGLTLQWFHNLDRGGSVWRFVRRE